jgi:hypothetical protein
VARLSNNGIGDVGAQALLTALETPTIAVSGLDVNNNPAITPKMNEALTARLQTLKATRAAGPPRVRKAPTEMSGAAASVDSGYGGSATTAGSEPAGGNVAASAAWSARATGEATATTQGPPGEPNQQVVSEMVERMNTLRMVLRSEAAQTRPSLKECRVCLLKIKPGESVLLPGCGHVMCHACATLNLSNEQLSHVCSVCGTVSTLPPHDELAMHPLVDMDTQWPPPPPTCAKCVEEDVDPSSCTVQCEVCAMALCPEHADLHRRGKRSQSHQLTPLHGVPTHLAPPEVVCHGQLMCSQCLPYKHHVAHGKDMVRLDDKEALDKAQAALGAAKTAVGEFADAVLSMVTETERARLASSQDLAAVRAKVKMTFALLVELLLRREGELVKQVDDLLAQHETTARTHEDELKLLWVQLEWARELTEASLHPTTAPNAYVASAIQLQMAAPIQSQVEAFKSRVASSKAVSLPSYFFDSRGVLDQSVREYGSILPVAAPTTTTTHNVVAVPASRSAP